MQILSATYFTVHCTVGGIDAAGTTVDSFVN